MPRDGSNIYHMPPGTAGVPDTTIESNKYNTFTADVETDLNTPRPIVAGGTGATSASAALVALGGEQAAQIVTNYDSNVFAAGSFYSATTATSPPVASHAFAGVCFFANATDMVLQARDLTDPLHPVYTRIMSGGVWSSWSLDGFRVFMTDAAPTGVADGSLWWESDTGSLYLRYRDPSGDVQWVMAVPPPDYSAYLLKSGDAMIGQLTLVGDPINPTHAADKHYVDASIASGIAGITGNVRYDISQSLTSSQQGQALANLGVMFGQCVLIKSGANLALMPKNGDLLTVNGVACAIPGAGVTLAPTGLTVGTLYYIYAVATAGVITSLEASTTGHATGSFGVEVKTGDSTRTLVGIAQITTGTVWADTPTLRLVRSWYNRVRLALNGVTIGANTALTASLVELNATARVNFVCWADDAIAMQGASTYFSSTAGQIINFAVNFDGSTSGLVATVNGDASGRVLPDPCFFSTTLTEGAHYATIFGSVGSGTASAYTSTFITGSVG